MNSEIPETEFRVFDDASAQLAFRIKVRIEIEMKSLSKGSIEEGIPDQVLFTCLGILLSVEPEVKILFQLQQKILFRLLLTSFFQVRHIFCLVFQVLDVF